MPPTDSGDADASPTAATSCAGTPRGVTRSRSGLLAACALLVIAATAVRTWVAAAGWFYWDDLLLHSLAARHPWPSPDLLFTDHDGHLMPVGMLLAWLAAHTAPLDFGLPLLQIALLQLLAGAALARMLWVLLRGRRILLVPLALALGLPLGLPTATWWSSALITLPLVAAMAWAAGATVQFARTGRRRHAISAVAATALGLLTVEKAVLVPVVAALALAGWWWTRGAGDGDPAAAADGGAGEEADDEATDADRARPRGVWRTTRPLWAAQTAVVAVWAVVFAVTVGRAGGGDVASDTEGPGPAVTDLLDQTYRLAVAPTLAGGPWRWERWHPGPPMADPTAVVAGVAVAVLVVAWSLLTRRRTGPIWAVAALYPAVSALLVAVGRAGPDTATEIVLTLRYHADAVVVLVAALALALAAPRREPAHAPGRGPARTAPRRGSARRGSARRGSARRGAPRWEPLAGAVLVAAVVSSSSVSTLAYRQVWAEQPSRDYLVPLVAALRERAEPMLDAQVPPEVLLPVTSPDNRLTAVLAGVDGLPPIGRWTTEPVVVDARGTLHPADVVPGRTIPQGPEPGCGHRVGPEGSRIALDGPLLHRDWVVRLNLLADADGEVVVRLDEGDEVAVPVRAGLGTVYVRVEGSGTGISVTPRQGVSDLCIGRGPVGVLVPR